MIYICFPVKMVIVVRYSTSTLRYRQASGIRAIQKNKRISIRHAVQKVGFRCRRQRFRNRTIRKLRGYFHHLGQERFFVKRDEPGGLEGKKFDGILLFGKKKASETERNDDVTITTHLDTEQLVIRTSR